MSERTVDAGRAIAHGIYAPINRWTESGALDPMFEKPQTAQVVRIKIEVVSLDSTSMAPSPDGLLLAGCRHCSDSTEWPLHRAQLPSRREGQLYAVEPPAGASAPTGVNDPDRR